MAANCVHVSPLQFTWPPAERGGAVRRARRDGPLVLILTSGIGDILQALFTFCLGLESPFPAPMAISSSSSVSWEAIGADPSSPEAMARSDEAGSPAARAGSQGWLGGDGGYCRLQHSERRHQLQTIATEDCGLHWCSSRTGQQKEVGDITGSSVHKHARCSGT